MNSLLTVQISHWKIQAHRGTFKYEKEQLRTIQISVPIESGDFELTQDTTDHTVSNLCKNYGKNAHSGDAF